VASPRIPESHRLALERLRTIPEVKIEEIIAALRQASLAVMRTRSLTACLKPILTDLSDDELENIADTLSFFYHARADADVPVTKFAAGVALGFRDLATEKFTEEEFTAFKARIEKLLDIDSVSMSAKASILETDYENTFCEAKILTDLRPVFGASIEDQPAGFVLTHTLKISYHDDSTRHREFYITLDEDDLSNMRDVLNRAEKKAGSLRSLLAKIGVRLFGTE
jgi:hypothetical protein